MFTKVNNSGSKLEADKIKKNIENRRKRKNKKKEKKFLVFQEYVRKRNAL